MRGRLPNPVVVIPGITGARLRDVYPIPAEDRWGHLRKDHEEVRLHPDDLRYESRQPSRVEADQLLRVPYGELVRELRHELSPRANEPTPVHPFAYDWRAPLARSDARLETFVQEVRERTRLLPHYHASDWGRDPRVDLVAHSMGGLVAAGLLARSGRGAGIGRVVSLGTPFRGSFEAVLRIITGLADLGGGGRGSSREREAARLTPALYHMLPSFEGALLADEGLPGDLFELESWQPGVVASLSEAIRLHGLDPDRDRIRRATGLLGSMLAEARRYREAIEALELEEAGLDSDDWLCVVGAGVRTRVRLRIRSERGVPEFELTGVDREDRWASGEGPERRRTGDGTVPLEGAVPPFLDERAMVVLTPDDLGYWEVADRILNRTVGFHGVLPGVNLVHRIVAAYLTRYPRRGVWGRAMPPSRPAAPGPDGRVDGVTGVEGHMEGHVGGDAEALAKGNEWRPPVPGIEER